MTNRLLLFITIAIISTAIAPSQTKPLVPGQINVMSATKLAFRAFPEADAVRRISRDVTREARVVIEAELPFKVHFEELGAHKLHVAFRGRTPIGMLYARSEDVGWGMAEIGWAMTLEGRLVGFEFASSRSKHTEGLSTSAFAKGLVGRDLEELRLLFAARPAPSGETGNTTAADLKDTVLKSALKATVVTAVVWQKDVDGLADLAMLYEEFPGAARKRPLIADLAPRQDEPRILESVRVMEALGRGGFLLGKAVRTRIRHDNSRLELRWVFDSRGTLLRVSPSVSWPGEELRKACSSLRGHRLDDPKLPATPLSAAARELHEEMVRLQSRSRRR